MARPKNTRYFLFEGKERTVSEIVREFFPTTANGTVYTRLVTSGATTREEYMAFITRGTKAAGARNTTEGRFSRQVRAKSDELAGEKGCNFCNTIRPLGKLKRVRGNRMICVYCDKDRASKLSSRNQQIVEYRTVSQFIKDKDELLKDAIRLLIKMKGDRRLWNGEVGFGPGHREDVNDIQRRFVALNLEEQP